jgi:DNA-binding MarR family transcriptional regulator
MMPQARALREALRHLLVAHQALQDNRRPCGKSLPLPHAYALLELLQRGPMRIKELSRLLSIDNSNVSRLCARMEEYGDLERHRDPEDGRAWRVALTAQGRTLAQSVDISSAAHFARLLEQLEDPQQITRALEALAQVMEQAREET